jgi:hypothetical protein
MKDAYYKAMALADGELDSSEFPTLVHELERDPALMRTAQSFIDLRRNRVAKLYAAKREESVPRRLLDTAASGPMGQRVGAIAFGRALFGRLREEYRISGFSFAAGAAIAAAVAVAVSTVLAPAPTLEPALSPQVQAALERATSKKDNPVEGMTFMRTYWSNNDTWCRQYDIASGGQRTSSLACRQDGQWRLVMQLPPASASAPGPAASRREFLDQFVGSHIKLEPEQAGQAAQSGWADPPGNGR